MKQLHHILYQLRPPLLASQPLARVLGSLCSTFAATSGLRVNFSSPDDLPALSEAQALVLYRCTQEGLNNVARHAKAASVWVSIDCVDGEINLSIEDDGLGFEPPAGGGPGLCLPPILSRVSVRSVAFLLSRSLNITMFAEEGNHSGEMA